ncbi:MAG: DUF3472 domain-containing protein [Planctomycetaceae bacterium]|nr:DUF3472 domain-containing protein [Planctomycetaceae bacterium]
MTRCLTAFAALFVACGFAAADEKLKDVACRSVHLGYPAPAGLAFYNEIAIEQTARGTYFAVCGWDKGYFGLQELGNGKKLAIFSVWDSKENDPSETPEEQRVKLLHKDEQTRIGRFGGEGSGGQSFYDLDWQLGETWKFVVTARPDGDRTEYAGWFLPPDKTEWTHMVTFSTITGGKPLRGYYSFVEDFRRNKVSASEARRAVYGNGWVFDTEQQWTPLLSARFTGDSNPATNIDAGLDGERFFLATGGATENAHFKLRETITRTAMDGAMPPEGLPVSQ